MKRIIFLLLIHILITGCDNSEKEPLEHIIEKNAFLNEIALQKDLYKVQIIYTQIDRDSLQIPHFTTFTFNLNPEKYFYPASTVKFPSALFALEKLNEINSEHIDLNTPFLIDSAFSGQTVAHSDSTSENLLPSIGHYIKKIFLVSDNDAFNRLYEFIGQEDLNNRLKSKGLNNSRITHRLSISLSEEENATTNPWRFVTSDSTLHSGSLVKTSVSFKPDTAIFQGKGYIKGGKLVNEPMDFSAKNFFPLNEQHKLLMSIIFPDAFSDEISNNLKESDYQFLYKYMSQWPSETTFPNYTDLPDNYVKFFLSQDENQIQDHIRVFNKVGNAYGFLTDNAYIVDFENKVELFLSATIYVNENEIFNDDTYEYDSIGYPFLSQLGQAIYNLELKRNRAFMPDLSRYSVKYDQ